MNPSTSFKRGDRVSATNTIFKMHGTVERLQAFTGLVRVRWDNRPGMFGSTVAAFSEWVHPSHLALLSREVSQATFSKGDVVEITAGHPSSEYRGALGVVVEVQKDADVRGTRYVVRPYHPSKPYTTLSRGPFHYFGHELVARRANGLVPVNFVREALGLKPTPGRIVDPPEWKVVGVTDSGADVLFASGGTLPPTSFPAIRHEATVSINIAPSAEAKAWLDALSQPTSIKITDEMRRRGITTQGDIRQIDEANISLTRRNAALSAKLDEANRRLEQGVDITDLVERAERAEREATKQRNRADFTKRLLNEARAEREHSESRARDYADNSQKLRREARAQRDRAELLAAKLTSAQQAVELLSRLGTPEHVADLQDELHRAHVSRQQAENRGSALEAEVRDLKNQLGAAVNRSRRRGEAIERIQNAVRGL